MTPATLLPATTRGRAVLALCGLAFAAERVAEVRGAAPGWAASFADDLVCLPLVLAVVAAGHRALGRPQGWTLPPGHGFVVAAAYAVCFEVLLPRWDAQAVADPRDVAAYLAGWAVYQLLIDRRP